MNNEQHSTPVDVVAAIGRAIDAGVARAEGSVVVKVVSFDRDANTVEVSPQVLRGKNRPPNVYCVPVLFPGAYYDVQPGEYGLLICCGLNWRRWWRTGEEGSPAEDRASHDLTNGIFLPGLRLQRDPRTLDANTIVVEPPAAGGEVRLGGHDADKPLLDGDAFSTAVDTFVDAIGAFASLVQGAFAGLSVPVELDTTAFTLAGEAFKSAVEAAKSSTVKVAP